MVNNIYGLTAHPFVSMSTDDASPTFLLLSINVTQPFSVGLYKGSDAEKLELITCRERRILGQIVMLWSHSCIK